MKKIFLLFFLIIVISIAFFFTDFCIFGFRKTSTKSVIYVNNSLEETISGRIELTISEKSPVIKFSILPKQRKELVLDWDEIRKDKPWGEGNIWFIIENPKGVETKFFLGEIELYEDGRNYLNGFKEKIEVKKQSNGKIVINTDI